MKKFRLNFITLLALLVITSSCSKDDSSLFLPALLVIGTLLDFLTQNKPIVEETQIHVFVFGARKRHF